MAYLLERILSSALVAQKAGLSLVHRCLDAGNPEPTAIRLGYLDRDLSQVELTQTTDFRL
ncbi:hypothetical protein AAFM46_07330 [Arthrobacter sp. TMP15]|uniref:hypothetical protein n=1 Tax=Arthrobacter sp. TMP15 TaxID=3140789 RepID=UPI0031B9F53C